MGLTSRPPCFRLVGWRNSDSTLWLWFWSGEKGYYAEAWKSDYDAMLEAIKHGTEYNFGVRGQHDHFKYVGQWPSDLDFTFTGNFLTQGYVPNR